METLRGSYCRFPGFHSIHGRAPALASGAKIANPDLSVWVVTGDGDAMSIGGNHLIHVLRRNLDLNILLFNNQIYGLTKGQYSATTEEGSKKRKGDTNEMAPIDLCTLAINLGCSFVARSFSGSRKQLSSLIRAAMSHKGMAVLDVISPCVTFNNNDESMKSYGYVKSNDLELHTVGYIPHFNPIEEVEIPAGEYKDVKMHDGSYIRLETIDEEHDPSSASMALNALRKAEKEKKHATGLLYFEEGKPTLDESMNLAEKSLCDLSEKDMRPSKKSLEDLLNNFRR